MAQRARGTFEVELQPLEPYGKGTTTLGRMSLDKRFCGDLEGVSTGEMLSAGTPQAGAAGYVAMELVTGMLHGRRGSFALQHSGTMREGTSRLLVTVVPGSGTGELAGLAGTMEITVKDGVHGYELAYTLAAPAVSGG